MNWTFNIIVRYHSLVKQKRKNFIPFCLFFVQNYCFKECDEAYGFDGNTGSV